MKKLKKVFVDGDIVNLKKGIFGYRVVHPIKDEKGNYIWINVLVGGWGNFWILIFILLVVSCFLYGFKEVTTSCRDMAKHPCNYFEFDCSRANYNPGIDFWIGGDTYEEEGT